MNMSRLKLLTLLLSRVHSCSSAWCVTGWSHWNRKCAIELTCWQNSDFRGKKLFLKSQSLNVKNKWLNITWWTQQSADSDTSCSKCRRQMKGRNPKCPCCSIPVAWCHTAFSDIMRFKPRQQIRVVLLQVIERFSWYTITVSGEVSKSVTIPRGWSSQMCRKK